MPTAIPTASAANLAGPDRVEVEHIARGLRSASRPVEQDDRFQLVVLEAVTKAMTGHAIDFGELEPIQADEFAAGLADRNEMFRTRLVQSMELGHLVLRQPDVVVADRIIEFAAELGIDNECIHKARAVADGSHRLVAADFDRNQYVSGLDTSVIPLTPGDAPVDAGDIWSQPVIDDGLAARWRSLGELAPDSIGRQVYDFYRLRGFAFPGEQGSAPPLLAQHDWVHLLADYGTTVESELEVFGFIARASDDPQAFALLAMTITLFHSGLLDSAAGIFVADVGHLCATGMPDRLADAMRRGALCDGSIDFLGIDWFALADQTVSNLRDHFGVSPKSPDAVRAGSPGPHDATGISEFQLAAGRRLAASEGREYVAPGHGRH